MKLIRTVKSINMSACKFRCLEINKGTHGAVIILLVSLSICALELKCPDISSFSFSCCCEIVAKSLQLPQNLCRPLKIFACVSQVMVVICAKIGCYGKICGCGKNVDKIFGKIVSPIMLVVCGSSLW